MIIKKSTFICHLYRIESEEEARDIIQQIKKEHWKASHNCSAYVLGSNQSIQRSSDDGEPSGTAGVPMLDILKVRDLKNVLAVVTRYFGGTKLGAGGLIRAYSGVVADAINRVGLVEGRLQSAIHVICDYAAHGKIDYFLENQTQYTLKETIYTHEVELIIMVDEKDVSDFKKDITNLLSGQVKIKTGEKEYVEIPVS